MKRARATMDARKRLVPCGSMSGRLRQPSSGAASSQADLVFEHVRRRIDLDVHGPPQGDPHRRAVAVPLRSRSPNLFSWLAVGCSTMALPLMKKHHAIVNIYPANRVRGSSRVAQSRLLGVGLTVTTTGFRQGDLTEHPPAGSYDIVSWLLTGMALFLVLPLHLLPALVAGLVVYELVQLLTRVLKIFRIHHKRGQLAAVGIVAFGVVLLLTIAGRESSPLFRRITCQRS